MKEPTQVTQADTGTNTVSDNRTSSALLRIFVGCTGLLGAALAVLGIINGTSHDAIMLGALVVAAAGAELFSVELFVDSHVSVSGAALMAAGAIFGGLGVALMAPAIVIAGAVRSHTSMEKNVFNFGALTIAGFAYVGAFRALDGNLDTARFSAIATPAILAGLANMAVNSSLVSGAIALDQQRSIVNVWRGNFLWLVPQYAVLGAVAIGVALAMLHFGTWSLALFALPLVSLSEALHTRADAMKMRNRALETIASVQVHKRAA